MVQRGSYEASTQLVFSGAGLWISFHVLGLPYGQSLLTVDKKEVKTQFLIISLQQKNLTDKGLCLVFLFIGNCTSFFSSVIS